ncbi:hypothetical protein [Streptomyces noursei]|nr:hypothetical protein [Streptomyces noursei]AIA00538.1 hypothetical protein DC74_10 [Streptomyces noursei]
MLNDQQLRDAYADALTTRTDEITDAATAAIVLRTLPTPRLANRPTVVCLCGSTRFWDELAEANLRETVAGRIVLAPAGNTKQSHPLWNDPQRADEIKQQLGALHRQKIHAADEVLVVNTDGYIGDSTRAEIRLAHELGRPVRYTDPLGYAVILTRPDLDPVRLGPFAESHAAHDFAQGLRRQMSYTAHVDGTVVDVGDYRPELDHRDAYLPTDPYALATAMDDDEHGDGTGRNFPDLYARLVAQRGYDAADLWGRACAAYDYMHSSEDEDE